MRQIEKKPYKKSTIEIVTLHTEPILAGSDFLGAGGDNNQPGAPTTAESQSFRWEVADTEWGEN